MVAPFEKKSAHVREASRATVEVSENVQEARNPV
jgi:hypothetical protein